MSWIGATVYKIRSRVKQSAADRQFRKNIEKYPPIIVYQMGKVGSTSIYNSLKTAYKGEVLHKHTLHKKEDWKSAMVLEHLLTHKLPLKLISLVREPVSRNISSFFQNFEKVTGIAPNKSVFTTEELTHFILTSDKLDTNAPLTWFNENPLKDFGIDVYSHDFPKEEGWTIIKTQGNTELLLMKAEISDTKKELLIRDFTRLPAFRLVSSNIGEGKDYAELYTKLKKEIRLPADYLDMFYSSPAVQHFYSESELEEARKKWNKR